MEKNNVYHLEFFMGDEMLGAHPQQGKNPSTGTREAGAVVRD